MVRRCFSVVVLLLLVGTNAFSDLKTVTDSEASKYVGESVAVKGIVANVYQSQKGNIFLNFGKPYPNQTFSAVIFSKDAAKFGNAQAYEGKVVIVTGVVQSYKGKAEIILKEPAQIKLANRP